MKQERTFFFRTLLPSIEFSLIFLAFKYHTTSRSLICSVSLSFSLSLVNVHTLVRMPSVSVSLWSISTKPHTKFQTNKSHFQTLYQENSIFYALDFFFHESFSFATLPRSHAFVDLSSFFLVLSFPFDLNVATRKTSPKEELVYGREKKKLNQQQQQCNNNKTKRKTNNQVFTQLYPAW